MECIKFPATAVGKTFKLCPNGALIYAGNRSINYIAVAECGNPTVLVFYIRQLVCDIVVDPKWPIDDSVNSNRFFATLFDDNIVQVWDFEKGSPVYGHKAHVQLNHVDGMNEKNKIVLLDFTCNHNVMSIDAHDIIVLCCTSYTYIRRRMFINLRSDKLSSLSCSQFNANIFAVGTARGVVYVCDIQKMAVMQSLRGHRETAITSIGWHCFGCNASAKAASDNDDDAVVDTNNVYLNKDVGQLTNTKSADCLSLEKENEEKNNNDKCQSSEKNIVFVQKLSSDESLEIIGSSSDDDVAVDGDPSLLKTKVVYQAQVHASSGGSDKSNQSIEKVENVDDIFDEVKTKEEDPKVLEIPKVSVSKVLEEQENQNSVCVTSTPDENEKMYSYKHPGESEHGIFKKHIVLTSVSTFNGVICIWDAQNGDLCDSIKTSGHSSHQRRQLSVHWVNEHTVIGINKDGEIMSWTCDPPTYDNEHLTMKFSKDKQLNFKFVADEISYNSRRQILWCKGGAQHQIICFDWVTKKVLASFNTVCNGIYDIKECPDDMNKILLGFCNYTFGLLDAVSLSPTNINIQYMLRSDVVVNCLTWSPDCLSFAYGTNEGTVGIISVENVKHTFQMNSVGNKPIFSLDWQKESSLYVSYKDKIALMDLKSKTKDATFIPEFVNSSYISFHGTFAFLGTQSGYLKVYRTITPTKFELVKAIKVLARYISEIAWSPIATNRFAVVGLSSEINIFAFNENSTELNKIETLTVDNMKCHFTNIKWSNNDGDRFVTSAFSGEVHVWDLRQKNNKLIFTKIFNCPIRKVMFLPTDENIVLCCGKNISLETFDIRSNATLYALNKRVSSVDSILWATKAPAVITNRKKKSGQKSTENQSLTNMEDDSEDHITDSNFLMLEDDCDVKTTKTETETKDSQLTVEDNCDVKTTKTVTETKERVKSNTIISSKGPTTVLYMIGKEINRNANQILLTLLNKQTEKETTCVCAKLFGSKEDLQDILNTELTQLKASGVTGTVMNIIPCLKDDIKDEIIKQAKAKKLTEWHLMMAPKVSISFWEKCMNAFALQLKEEGKSLQCACTLLAINKPTEAVKVLREHNLFRESFLVARLYLQPDDIIIDTIFNDWVSFLDRTGNFGGASLLCYLTGERQRAYDFISKIRQRDIQVENIIQLFENSNV